MGASDLSRSALPLVDATCDNRCTEHSEIVIVLATERIHMFLMLKLIMKRYLLFFLQE